MKINTTIYIRLSLLSELNKLIEKHGVSRSYLISTIFQKVIRKDLLEININNAVKYQKRELSDTFKRFHVSFSKIDYEIITDLRKITKKSVSLVIANGIKRYINEINQELEKQIQTDNILNDGYFINMSFKNNRNIFKIIWGRPNNFNYDDNYHIKAKTLSELKKFLK